jgi:cardiolipin synthase
LLSASLAGTTWDFPAVLLAAAHVAVACAVSVHVLLRKRDVGSAIGWIGLSWLSPVAGGVLYFVFGINRVRRRARQLRDQPPLRYSRLPGDKASDRADHLAPLERAASVIAGRPATPGNAFDLLQNGDEAYPRMLAAIAGAGRSIALATYILRDDAAGGPFIDALIAASRRGVAVRVLLDGIGSGYFVSSAYRRLRRQGVPTARFMHSPLPWRMPFLNLRTHKKVLVVDGRTGFAGGLNIGQENLLSGKPRWPVRDTHFAIAGPVVGQLVSAFAQDWLFATGEQLDDAVWWPDLAHEGEAVARVVTSGPDQELERIEFLMLQAVTCAASSIRIMTPYFLPDDRLITMLATAAMRGIEVDIVIPERSNYILIDWATRANIGPLLAAGCRIWLNPPPFEHSKLMVIDAAWCLVGSANWDMRSLRLNFELNVAICHDAMAGVLEARILAKRGRPLIAEAIAARSLPVRLRDAGARLFLPYL